MEERWGQEKRGEEVSVGETIQEMSWHEIVGLFVEKTGTDGRGIWAGCGR